MPALIDTGASVSCCSYVLVQGLAIQSSPFCSLVTANGGSLAVVGKTTLSFRLASEDFSHSFFVVRNLSQEIILGLDFLSKNQVFLDCARRSLTFTDKSPVLHVPIISADTSIEDFCEMLFQECNTDFKSGAAVCEPHAIHLVTDTKPVKQKLRRMAYTEKDKIDAQVKEMLRLQVIRPSRSPWSSPVQLVPKKSGETRFCVDYRKLNALTIPDAFPLPRIADVRDGLRGSCIFSSLDLKSGYWQIPLHSLAKPLTAFSTTTGHYEFNVMPFGLTNAPATFQRVMNTLFSDLSYVFVYLDDVIVFSKSKSDHRRHLTEVFTRLRNARFTINKEKCALFKDSIQYLGMMISADGIRPIPERVKAIQDLSPPSNRKQLQEFFGLINYYRDYCPDLATIASPLYKLLRKDVMFTWTVGEYEAFEKVKTLLSSPPLLGFPDPNANFVLATDASKSALGAVLSQIQNNKEVPIAYASRVLSPVEEKYSVIEKELLAMVFAVRKFHPHLYGSRFTIITDHNPLQYALKIKDPTSRIARWVLALQEYSFTVQYKPGRLNSNADALSRPPHQIAFISTTETSDSEFKQLLRGEMIPNNSPYFSFRDQLLSRRDQLWFDTGDKKRLVVPTDQRNDILFNAHSIGHFGIKKTYELVKATYWWPGLFHDVKKLSSQCVICQRRKPPSLSQSPDTPGAPRCPTYPNEIVAWDIMGPIQDSRGGHKYILVIMDLFSHWTETTSLRDATATTLLDCLWRKWIARYGTPAILHSDNGKNFTANVVKTFCHEWAIKMTTSPVYHPESNGMVERMNRTLQDAIAKSLQGSDGRDWNAAVSTAVFAHNVTVHSRTNISPFALFFGRHPRVPLSKNTICVPPNFSSSDFVNIKRLFEKLRKNLETGEYLQPINEGENVLVYRPSNPPGFPKKFSSDWHGPFKILSRRGFTSYSVGEGTERTSTAHMTNVKPFIRGEFSLEPTTAPSERRPGLRPRVFKPRRYGFDS